MTRWHARKAVNRAFDGEHDGVSFGNGKSLGGQSRPIVLAEVQEGSEDVAIARRGIRRQGRVVVKGKSLYAIEEKTPKSLAQGHR